MHMGNGASEFSGNQGRNGPSLITFIQNLKTAYDFTNGLSTGSARVYADRLSVESRCSGEIYFFRVLPGQKGVDSTGLLYQCEKCPETSLLKNDVKKHVCNCHEG